MIEREPTRHLRGSFAAALDIKQDGDACPPADRIWFAARGGLDRAAAAEVLWHCGECGACAEGWRLARSAVRPNRLRSVLAVAALFVVTGLVALMLSRPVRESPPVLRQLEPGAIRSTVEAAWLPRDECRLAWTPAALGSRYDLRVMRENLDLLHEAWSLSVAEARVPPAALESVPPGSHILWQVTVRSPEGDTRVSDTFTTVVE